MILTKDEVVKMAREAGFIIGRSVTTGEPNSPERFATLCRAPLVAENAALKHAHEINAVMERAEAAWLADKERTLDFDIVAGRAIESALLDKLLKGVEVPELQELSSPHDERAVYGHSRDQLLAYGAAQRLAGREQAIEECAAECLVLHANGNYKHDTREDCHDAIRALAASPQEQT